MKHRKKNELTRTDVVTYVLAAALLVTLALASLYGFRYGNVDESTVPGKITIYVNEEPWLIVKIDESMNAEVGYVRRTMTGTLKLAGAEEDSILYQLRNIEFTDGSDASDAVLFIRMPRSGLQGDYSGPWMAYYSLPSEGIMRSNWFIASEDGTAFVGARDNMNAITAQHRQLIEWSANGQWEKRGEGLYLTTNSD